MRLITRIDFREDEVCKWLMAMGVGSVAFERIRSRATDVHVLSY